MADLVDLVHMEGTINKLIGAQISLVTNAMIRYEGIVEFIDLHLPRPTQLKLIQVKVCGTEERSDLYRVEKQTGIYPMILFDVKQIYAAWVIELPPEPEPAVPDTESEPEPAVAETESEPEAAVAETESEPEPETAVLETESELEPAEPVPECVSEMIREWKGHPTEDIQSEALQLTLRPSRSYKQRKASRGGRQKYQQFTTRGGRQLQQQLAARGGRQLQQVDRVQSQVDTVQQQVDKVPCASMSEDVEEPCSGMVMVYQAPVRGRGFQEGYARSNRGGNRGRGPKLTGKNSNQNHLSKEVGGSENDSQTAQRQFANLSLRDNKTSKVGLKNAQAFQGQYEGPLYANGRFFDDISSEATQRPKGKPKYDWRAQQKLNYETFGSDAAAAEEFHHRRPRYYCRRGGGRRGIFDFGVERNQEVNQGLWGEDWGHGNRGGNRREFEGYRGTFNFEGGVAQGHNQQSTGHQDLYGGNRRTNRGQQQRSTV